jgi:hypothetical protein
MVPISVMGSLEQYSSHAVQHAYAMAEAKRTFRRVYRRSWMYKVWAFLNRQSPRMLDLHQIEATVAVRNRHYSGVQTVALDCIRGSENRVQDFDAHFNPVRRYTESRWVNIATALLQGKFLPPVELIRMGETYFVRDGHHRISAARALGQKEIEAVVTTWEVNEEKHGRTEYSC